MLRRHDADALTSKDVYDAAMAGDALAKEVFDFTGRVLGEACADFVASTAPQSIIFFGGLSKAGDLLMRKPLQEEFERNLLFVYAGYARFAAFFASGVGRSPARRGPQWPTKSCRNIPAAYV